MRITGMIAAQFGMMLLAIAIAVAAPAASAEQGEEAAIRLLSNKWQKDKQDLDAIVALHAPDAVVLMSHESVREGIGDDSREVEARGGDAGPSAALDSGEDQSGEPDGGDG